MWEDELQRLLQCHWRREDASRGVFYHCTVIMLSFVNSRRPVCLSDWVAVLVDSAGSVVCCSSWSVGEWGVCSRSCGGGEQTRQVQCVQRTSQTNVDTLADSHCAQPTPARRQTCSAHNCPPVWTTGPWSQVKMQYSALVQVLNYVSKGTLE